MKAILMSIRPQHVANILNGDLSLLVLKKFPKDYVGWVYIYCTKDSKLTLERNTDEPYNFFLLKDKKHLVFRLNPNHSGYNGKVVARFWCDKVEEIVTVNRLDTRKVILYRGHKDGLTNRELMEGSCLTFKEMNDYLRGNKGYAIHITNLEIFDKPKEISEFKYHKHLSYPEGMITHSYHIERYTCLLSLTRAPRNYCFIEI